MSALDDEVPELVEFGAETSEQASGICASRVPVTIISGFLGAGKSTLLKRILTERHGYRIAVIMNEFGDTADIESRAIQISSAEDPTASSSEEFLELANGCLCCSIKDSGVAAIEKLMQRKGAFDYILLETTGLADPGPIASIFWQNEEFAKGSGKDIVLDGVLCVVDAVFGKTQIEEDRTGDEIGDSLRQIAAADVLLLNKVDLVSPDEAQAMEALLRAINPSAQVYRTIRGDIELGHVINIKAYASGPLLQQGATSSEQCDKKHGQHNNSHLDDERCGVTHYEVKGISSLQARCPALSITQLFKLDEWIRTVLWDNHLPTTSAESLTKLQVLRCKGLFILESGEKYILQGVRNMYEMVPLGEEGIDVPEQGKLVLIGKGLNEAVRVNLLSIFQ
ncbi:cobW-domain-containing protein [Dentipellis sp. KUC8613]|nr:cobW-domain-containing protein [Dentipellis sp. KUC8613]